MAPALRSTKATHIKRGQRMPMGNPYMRPILTDARAIGSRIWSKASRCRRNRWDELSTRASPSVWFIDLRTGAAAAHRICVPPWCQGGKEGRFSSSPLRRPPAICWRSDAILSVDPGSHLEGRRLHRRMPSESAKTLDIHGRPAAGCRAVRGAGGRRSCRDRGISGYRPVPAASRLQEQAPPHTIEPSVEGEEPREYLIPKVSTSIFRTVTSSEVY